MADQSSAFHISFNGEVYNFRQLRDELTALGHRFKTSSDTEVLLEGYKRWDVGVLQRLRGMFAFALWDTRRRRLLLVRDRLGKKPLYYAWHERELLFASEIKGILAGSLLPRKPNFDAIDRYLTFQYVPTPETAFVGIEKLRPGHFMVIESGRPPIITRYWEVPRPIVKRASSAASYRAELLWRFDDAVRCRLVSDVPVGAFLSGGIDSASVVASMARATLAPIQTFTIGFDEPEYDERENARLVAQTYGTQHHEFVVRPNIVSILPELVWHYGEPFADPSAVPTYCVAEIARRDVKVVLNGDGGDENFLGYPRYAAAWLGQGIDALPKAVRAALGAAGRALPIGLNTFAPVRYLGRFLAEADSQTARRYGQWLTVFSDIEKRRIYGDGLRDRLDRSSLVVLEPWFDLPVSVAARAAYADMNTYLPDDILTKVDVACMAHGLESRSPFLDQELMAFAATIPASLKMRGLRTKALLRSAMAMRLPAKVVSGRKMGFGVPIDRWFRAELREMAYDVMLSEGARSRGLFKPEAVRTLLEEHTSGLRRHHHRLWALLFLELWFRTWIDAPQSEFQRPSALV
jgi:asparagine synthase (glutamine-hydrolysing)